MAGGQRSACVAPDKRRDIEEAFNLGNQCRQHRFEQDSELAEEVERVGAGGVQVRLAAFLLGQFPRFYAINVLVGEIGQRHDFTDRLAKFTTFKQLRDASAAFADRDKGG